MRVVVLATSDQEQAWPGLLAAERQILIQKYEGVKHIIHTERSKRCWRLICVKGKVLKALFEYVYALVSKTRRDLLYS